MHVKVIDKIPDEIFINAKNEVMSINWDDLPFPDRRSEASVFKTSITNHIRIHDVKPGTPHTIKALSAIVDCIDTPARELYPSIDTLVSWIYNRVDGCRLGRIMIVKLSPGGIIDRHIDPGKYFLNHYRFHVPFVTDPQVLFYGETDEEVAHMPEGMLSQLANRRLHSAKNLSDINRIHLIVDIDSKNLDYVI